MEMESLKQKRKFSRILYLAVPVLAVLVTAVVYEYGYLAVQEEIASIVEMQEAKTKTLKKNLALIAQKPELEKQLAVLKGKRTADDRKLFEGQTPSIAAAALQNTIKASITGRSGTISSERVEKPEAFGKYKLIGVSLDAVLPDIKALADVLYNIETQTPYLIVKELDVRCRNINDPRDLAIRMRVSALTAGR